MFKKSARAKYLPRKIFEFFFDLIAQKGKKRLNDIGEIESNFLYGKWNIEAVSQGHFKFNLLVSWPFGIDWSTDFTTKRSHFLKFRNNIKISSKTLLWSQANTCAIEYQSVFDHKHMARKAYTWMKNSRNFFEFFFACFHELILRSVSKFPIPLSYPASKSPSL